MSRTKTTKTRYVGVHSLDGQPNTYRLRGSVKNVKTGKDIELDKIVTASSPLQASRERQKLLDGLQTTEPAGERKRLGDYATSWLRTKLNETKASTGELYAGVLDEHILPVFGEYYLDQITRDDLLEWREAQKAKPLKDAHGRERMNPDGTPILPEIVTINGRMRVFTNLMADAVAVEKLPRDPTLRLGKLRPAFDEDADDGEGEAKSIEADELRALLEAAREHTPHWYPFFYVLAFTGLRFGEITALKWRDLDEESGKIWIRRSQWKGTVDSVKNTKPRTVPLMPELLAALNAHREEQRAAFTKRAKRRHLPDISVFAGGDWVFPSRMSLKASAEGRETIGLKLMHNTAPRKALIKATAKAGLAPGFTIHGFRHTFNNLVRNVAELNGQKIVLQAMTGHSSDEMTEHYSQVSIEEKRKAVGGLLRLVQGGS